MTNLPLLKKLAEQLAKLHAETENETADARNAQFERVALRLADEILKPKKRGAVDG